MKPNIAFLTGGYSGEAQISYLSAATILRHLSPDSYTIFAIDITREGWFYLPDGKNRTTIEIDKNDFSLNLPDGKIKFDLAFIGIHGSPGEDGRLQGYFDMLGIAYTGCNHATSALTFNKRYTVGVAAMSGIKVARSVLLFSYNDYDVTAISKELRYPLFVKPNNGGSSIGMSKIFDPSELQTAIDKAFGEDNQVLIEEYIEGRELTIGVFRHKGQIITLPMTEIMAKNTFFDFEAKYKGESEEITPAAVSDEVANQIRATAAKLYQIFDCAGVIRIDFIFHKIEKIPYLLEINTVPGQTEASLVPQQLHAMGWTLERFYAAIIEETLRSRFLV